MALNQLVYISNDNLVHFVVIWYIFPRFGMLYQEKSGNPGLSSGPFQIKSGKVNNSSSSHSQGDKTGRSFAIWAIFFGNWRIFFRKNRIMIRAKF
jgi:hypothetical protein